MVLLNMQHVVMIKDNKYLTLEIIIKIKTDGKPNTKYQGK